MECSNTFIEAVISILEVSSLTYSIYLYGYIKGIALIGLIYTLYCLFVRYVLNLHALTYGDKILLSDNFYKTQVILAQVILENFNTDRMYEAVYERTFKKIPKLTYVLTYKFFNFYWKETSLNREDEIKRRIIIHKPMTEEENITFRKSELSKQMNIFDRPIEFHIIPCLETKQKDGSYSKGYMYIKNDHSFTDGLGLLSILTCMSDDFKIDLFPRIMFNRTPSLIEKIRDFLLFVVLGIPVLIYSTFHTKSHFKLSKMPRTNNVSTTKPIDFDFHQVKKRSKELKMSINEICLSSTLAAIKRQNPDAKKISMEVPIGLSPVPGKMEDIKLANHVFALFNVFNLIQNPLKDLNIFKADYRALLSQAFVVRIETWATIVIANVLPFNVAKAILMDIINEVDVTCSNLPGTTRACDINGNKVVQVIPYTSTGYLSAIFGFISYNDLLTLILTYDEGQTDLGAEKIVEHFIEIMNNILYNKELDYCCEDYNKKVS